MEIQSLRILLDSKVVLYNQPAFIDNDPISIPHRYTRLQDIEIAAFFSAILSWGNRSTIIRSAGQAMDLMDNTPYDFILHHREGDLQRLLQFRHRTFNATDLLFFIEFLHVYYQHFESLETAFSGHLGENEPTVEKALNGFRRMCFAGEFPARTEKHISSPEKNSSCKRLNMMLRWLVRKDQNGVDFGVWQSISPSQLICPMDVHVVRVARKLGLIQTDIVNWATALTLTDNLRKFDPADPVKYDFALFGLGAVEKYG